VDSSIVVWMVCVTVNNIWKLLHSRWNVVLWVEWSVLQWTLYGRYCAEGGQCYCGLYWTRNSEQYAESTAQRVDCGIVGGMECLRVNSMWKVLHNGWTLVLCVEWSALQWTVCGKYCTAGGQWDCGLNVVCFNEQYVEGTAQQVDSGIVGWM